MSKSTSKKTQSPNKLTKTGKTSGIALTEKQLDQASGGASFLKIKLTSPTG